MNKLRITVVKKMLCPEFFERWGSDTASPDVEGDESCGTCYYFKEGQSFVLDGIDDMTFMTGIPNGFCTWAWQAITPFAMMGLRDGTFHKSWMKDENKMLVCCLDALRPVVFLLEVFKDGEEMGPVPEPFYD